MKETWLQRGGKGLWPDVNTIEGSNAASNCGWWVQLSGSGGTGMTIILTLFFLIGIRRTFAYQRHQRGKDILT